MKKETYIAYGDIELHLSILEYERNAPCVVFIPGSGCYAELYTDFLEALNRNGFNVLGLTFEGHGKSGGKRGHLPYADAIGNIRATVDYATKNYGRVGICGSSLGGILSLYATLEIDEINCAVCHNVLDVRDLPFDPSVFSSLDLEYVPLKSLFDWNKVFDDEENLRKLKNDRLMVWEYTLRSLLTLFDRNKPKVEDMKKPTMILVSEGDEILAPEVCERVYNKLKCKKKFVNIPSVGHMLFIEHIDEVIEEVVSWFKEYL